MRTILYIILNNEVLYCSIKGKMFYFLPLYISVKNSVMNFHYTVFNMSICIFTALLLVEHT